LGDWLKFGVLVAICLIPLFIAPAFASSSLYAKINPEEPTSYFEMKYQRTIFIEYDEGGIFAGILSGRSWETRVSADSSNSGVKDLQNKLNQKITVDGSGVQISDLNVEYSATLEGKGLVAYFDYNIILSGKLSDYVITEDEQRTILDLGWRGMTVYEPVIIDGVEINFPISAIKEKEAYVYNKIVGTQAEDLLSEPLMNAESIKDKPLTTWNFSLNPDGTFSTFTIDKTRIERVKNAAFTVDKFYNVKSIESHDSANLQVFGFAAVDNLEGLEILGVTPTAPEEYKSKTESSRTGYYENELYEFSFNAPNSWKYRENIQYPLVPTSLVEIYPDEFSTTDEFAYYADSPVIRVQYEHVSESQVPNLNAKDVENYISNEIRNVIGNGKIISSSVESKSWGWIVTTEYFVNVPLQSESIVILSEEKSYVFKDRDAYLVSYRTTDTFFDDYHHVFETMLDSLVIEDTEVNEPEIFPISIPSDGGGCLIATATFGSELAPQVQMLREIRDNSLLQTQSGQSFMQGFNQFYYSFSPTIADYERENPTFKEAVKVTITPLLASLSLLNYVDMDSEESVLGYGIGIIMMNVGMYFVVPVIVIHRIKKILNS